MSGYLNGSFFSAIIGATVVAIVTILLNLWLIPTQIKRTISSQQQWLMKRDVYLKSLNLIDRHMNSTSWIGEQVPETYKPQLDLKPTAHGINQVCTKLALTSEDKNIASKFAKFFKKGGGSSPADRAEYIGILRKDLFNQEEIVDKNTFPFFFNENK